MLFTKNFTSEFCFTLFAPIIPWKHQDCHSFKIVILCFNILKLINIIISLSSKIDFKTYCLSNNPNHFSNLCMLNLEKEIELQHLKRIKPLTECLSQVWTLSLIFVPMLLPNVLFHSILSALCTQPICKSFTGHM